ncbi:MAG: VacB/RNase II family 3'-5' exoribonuclease, partial [Myxococcota bacterium]
FERGTSTYLTDRAIPMLPEALSNGLCSLNPNVDRLCVVAELILDDRATVLDTKFYPAVMRSKARLTYEQVAQALEGQPDATTEPLLPNLLLLAKVASRLLNRRLKRGAIDLDMPEAEVVFDEEGLPIDAIRRPRNDAHRLIEDLMLAANEAVARYFMEREQPSIYRVHEPPDPTKLAMFATVCRTLGLRVRLSDNPKPAELAQLLIELSDHPSGKAMHPLLLRSMSQARYDEEPKGHFGLAAEAYLHFTSPIRRYPDLIVHRLLKQSVAERSRQRGPTELQNIAQQCSERERQAMVAERQSIELDRTLLARARLGQAFRGHITGVQGFGLFVALDHPFIEGLVPVQTLPEDFYEVDEASIRLTGERTGRTFHLGDEVEVTIVAANIARRQVELALVDDEASTGRRQAQNGRTPDDEERKEGRSFNAQARIRQLRAERGQDDEREGRHRPRGRGRGGPRGRGPRGRGPTGRRGPGGGRGGSGGRDSSGGRGGKKGRSSGRSRKRR